MPNFESLFREFENTNNLCKFYEDYKENNVSTRFLLIRSLDKPHLIDVINLHIGETTEKKPQILMKIVYESDVTIQQILDYIETKRQDLIAAREAELQGLEDVLANIPVVNCGVRNDKVDDIVKAVVRNKTLKTIDELEQEIDNAMLPRIRQYTLWSYCNQTANDIIELFLLKHPLVIPTLRKIHDIDFFVKLENQIIPFDLKFTHISDSYFDLVSQGLTYHENASDDFSVVETGTSEIKSIKDFYKGFKKQHGAEYDLPNLKDLEKNDILEVLLSTGNERAIAFVNQAKENHAAYVPATSDQLRSLEWWNYKFQGERLFSNNNRLFVFLAYKNRFQDGRELKGKTAEIGEKISQLLTGLTDERIHTISYHYDKQADLVGDYKAKVLSTIYFE